MGPSKQASAWELGWQEPGYGKEGVNGAMGCGRHVGKVYSQHYAHKTVYLHLCIYSAFSPSTALIDPLIEDQLHCSIFSRFHLFFGIILSHWHPLSHVRVKMSLKNSSTSLIYFRYVLIPPILQNCPHHGQWWFPHHVIKWPVLVPTHLTYQQHLI